jgi:quinol monooxygenase YgiN
MNNKLLLILIAITSLLVGCDTVSHSSDTDDVYWLITASINDGQLANVKSINKELVSASLANEPMTLVYDWSISADGKTCYFFERYDNSEAVMIHDANFNEKFAERLMPMIEIQSFKLFGNPNAEVLEMLSGFGASFHQSIGGFAR